MTPRVSRTKASLAAANGLSRNEIEVPGYLVTNEDDIGLFLDALASQSCAPEVASIDVFLGTTHALRFVVNSRSREFYLFDSSPRVIEFHRLWRQLCLAAQGDLHWASDLVAGPLPRLIKLLSRESGGDTELATRLLDPAAKYPLYRFHRTTPSEIVDARTLWKRLQSVSQSVFADPRSFARLHMLYRQERVHFLVGSLDHPAIGEAMIPGNVVRNLYLSNMENYLFRGGAIASFLDFLERLAGHAQPDARLFRTIRLFRQGERGAFEGFIPDVEELAGYLARMMVLRTAADDPDDLRRGREDAHQPCCI